MSDAQPMHLFSMMGFSQRARLMSRHSYEATLRAVIAAGEPRFRALVLMGQIRQHQRLDPHAKERAPGDNTRQTCFQR